MRKYSSIALFLLAACGGELPLDLEDSYQPDINDEDSFLDKHVSPPDAGSTTDSTLSDAPLLDSETTDDASIPKPDSSSTEPDSSLPEPDSSLPEPDSSQPEPDLSIEPDTWLPDSSPEPDSSALPDASVSDATEPDSSEPDASESDAGGYQPPGDWLHIPGGVYLRGGTTSTSVLPLVVSDTEVTVGQYQTIGLIRPHFAWHSTAQPCGGGVCPAERVSWHQAARYCNRLSEKSELDTCYSCVGEEENWLCEEAYGHQGDNFKLCEGYRLPLAEEWEYLYRAGTTTDYYNGDIISPTGTDPRLHVIAWYMANSLTTGSKHSTQPVAQKIPNDWDLYDMAGNVAEWNHSGSACGGAWNTSPIGCIGTCEDGDEIPAYNYRSSSAGFRCVRTDY